MKTTKRYLLLLAVMLALAIPNAAFAEKFTVVPVGGDSSGQGSGSCLNAYNNCLYNCDYTTIGNTNVGCKADCFYSYYSCIARSATN